MQRLVHLCTGTSRLVQVVGVNHVKNSKFFIDQHKIFSITNNLIVQRYLSTKNNDSKNKKGVDTHPDMYKPSTAKEEQHIPDDLKGGQSPETYDTNPTSSSTGSSKVWSTQRPDDVHVGPLGRVQSTKFVSSSVDGSRSGHDTTVYTTQGKVNIADPFQTHTLKPEATPAEAAEAAAASAFEPFAPDTSSTPVAEVVFAPKISSTGAYSKTSSPTAHFDTAVPTSSPQETVKYEIAAKGKVYGGQDTTAESKKHPKENPFNTKEKVQPEKAK